VLSQSELPWVLHDIFQGPSTKLRNQTWIALASRMTASVSIQTFTKKIRVGGLPQQKETFESWKCTSQATLLGSFLSLQLWLCATMRSLVQQGRSPLGSCSPTLQRFTCGRADWKSGVGSWVSVGNSAASAKQPDSSNLCIYHGYSWS
jgi:hypothetical protein